MRKVVFVVLVFLLPVAVFLFLRYFGKNEFDIPIFYKDTIEMKVGCNYNYITPYIVPDSITSLLNSKKSKALLVVDDISKAKHLKKIRDQFSFEELEISYLTDFSDPRTKRWKSCFLFLLPPFSSLVIDDQGRIRGYYQQPTIDEVDKMEVELRILLKKY